MQVNTDFLDTYSKKVVKCLNDVSRYKWQLIILSTYKTISEKSAYLLRERYQLSLTLN